MYYSIELIRLLSVILITFTHIRHNFSDGVMNIFLDQIPMYGTLILSVISGFLYAEVTSRKDGLLNKKVRSLLIPYLIANIVVIIPVLAAHYLGYDFLNRLSVDADLLWTGLFSISAAPVNPPTYFIRDLFIIFLLVEVVRSRNFYLFGGIIVLAFFGNLLLRYDILILFIIGIMLSRYKIIHQQYARPSVIVCLGLSLLFLYLDIPYDKHLIAILFFILVINWKVDFKDVGGYSYTLHLYHSPVVVVLFPVFSLYIGNEYLLVIAQLIAVFFCVSVIYLLIRKFNLKFAIGGR
ncbi:MAG: hypothetical protein WD059_02850 [Balneolaceae bacterium]